MEKRLLECGHTQPVPAKSVGVWCPICNEVCLVKDGDGAEAA
jgi:hypothetical protein